MDSRLFLAATQWEMEEFSLQNPAYMACRFSPYSSGLTNLPKALPPGSLLLLDDSNPVTEHNPEAVIGQLQELILQFSPCAVLLDFQNPVTDAAQKMAASIVQALPCPVAVTEAYALGLNCPVFLSPPPVNVSLQKYLTSWNNREIFLEVTGDMQQFIVTEQGCTAAPLPVGTVYHTPLSDQRFHCHYQVEVFTEKVIFTLQRTREDLLALAEEALHLGVRCAVGLYQELK